MNEAATPTGAESSAHAEVSATDKPASINDRIKAAIFAKPEQAAMPASDKAEPESKAPPKAEKPKVEPKETAEDEPAEVETEEDAEGESQAEPQTLDELASALGWDLDKILNLSAKTKIDGAEGSKSLRDLLKSHQLEGHLNQKLMTHAEEKKAFELELSNRRAQQQQQFLQLNETAQVAQKLLEGDLAGIDWAQLEQDDPLTFNQNVVKFQRRNAQIQQIQQQVAQERAAAEAQAAKQFQAYRADQAKLLETKIPEWTDKSKRDKEIADICSIAKEAYGLGEKEIKSENNHQLILVLRDAVKWQQLQKSRPAVLKKINSAPRLLKPGTPQSKSAQDALIHKSARDQLKKTGKVSDATKVFKQILFR